MWWSEQAKNTQNELRNYKEVNTKLKHEKQILYSNNKKPHFLK